MTRRRALRPPRLAGVRRIAAWLAAVFMITGTGLVIVAGPASAITIPFVGNCKSPPAPQVPGGGVSAWISGRPSPLPAAGAAFGADPTSTEYEQYGYAGLSWSYYDLGCVTIDVGTQVDTMAGNMLMAAAKTYVAFDNQVHGWAASPAWINDLNPLVISTSRVMHDDLFNIWAGVALLIVGITIINRGHKGDMADAVTKFAWALGVLALVGGLFNYPTLAGSMTSSLMTQTLNAMDAGFTGPGGEANAAQSHDSLIVTSVLYDQWVYGELGPDYTQTSQTYGPELFQAQALTWQQAAASPQQVAKTETTDESTWEKIAAQVQTADPSAYQNLKGTGQSRIGAGALALLLALVVCTFDIYASLVVIMALLSVLMAVIILPGLAVVGLHHGARNFIIDVLSKVAGLLVAAVLYAAAAGVDSRATILLLTTHAVPLQMAILLLAVLPFLLWVMLRRLRNRPVVPRAVLAGAGLLGMRYWTRGGAKAGVQQGLAEQGDFWSNYHGGNWNYNFYMNGQPGWWTPPGGGAAYNRPNNLPPGGGGGLPNNPPGGLPPGGGGGGGGGGGPFPPPNNNPPNNNPPNNNPPNNNPPNNNPPNNNPPNNNPPNNNNNGGGPHSPPSGGSGPAAPRRAPTLAVAKVGGNEFVAYDGGRGANNGGRPGGGGGGT